MTKHFAHITVKGLKSVQLSSILTYTQEAVLQVIPRTFPYYMRGFTQWEFLLPPKEAHDQFRDHKGQLVCKVFGGDHEGPIGRIIGIKAIGWKGRPRQQTPEEIPIRAICRVFKPEDEATGSNRKNYEFRCGIAIWLYWDLKIFSGEFKCSDFGEPWRSRRKRKPYTSSPPEFLKF